jgi:Protein of unknown function (DUF2800)
MKEEKFSPSSYNSLEICPGYRHRPDEGKPAPAAEIGKEVHSALETGHIEELVNEDAKHMARQCADYIDALLADKLPALPTQDFKERKLSIDFGNEIKTNGIIDRLIIYGQKGHVIDYKTGRLEVIDADVNLQLWAYVVAAFQAHPELQHITGHMLMPRQDEVTVSEFDRSFLPQMTLRINTIVRRAMECNPELFNPQPGLCIYCARQGNCPALGKKALLIANKLGVGLTIPQSIKVSKDRPGDIPQILNLVPVIEAWANGQRKEALRLNLEEGVQIAGYQRVTRSLPRAVTSVLGAYEAVKDKMTFEAYLAACSKVSVVQLEDYFADQAPNKAKGKARQDLENRLRGAGVLRDKSDIYYLKKSVDLSPKNVVE